MSDRGPIRAANVDSWSFAKLGIDSALLTQRLMAGSATTRTPSPSARNADDASIKTIQSDPQYANRDDFNQYEPYVDVSTSTPPGSPTSTSAKALATAFPTSTVQKLSAWATGNMRTPDEPDRGRLARPSRWASRKKKKSRPERYAAKAKAVLSTAGKVGYTM